MSCPWRSLQAKAECTQAPLPCIERKKSRYTVHVEEGGSRLADDVHFPAFPQRQLTLAALLWQFGGDPSHMLASTVNLINKHHAVWN